MVLEIRMRFNLNYRKHMRYDQAVVSQTKCYTLHNSAHIPNKVPTPNTTNKAQPIMSHIQIQRPICISTHIYLLSAFANTATASVYQTDVRVHAICIFRNC